MRLPGLDSRLMAAANLFDTCDYAADIGSDHGRLPCYLLAYNIVKNMVVSDVSAKALEKARTLLTRHNLLNRAELIIADGLEALTRPSLIKKPIEAISILGMGGDTIINILSADIDLLSGATLILSPHTEIAKLRGHLSQMNYYIHKEAIIEENKRFYIIIKARPGTATYNQKEIYLGPDLLKTKTHTYILYLKWQLSLEQKALKACENVLRAKPDDESLYQSTLFRMNDLNKKIAYIQEALA